MENFYPSIFSMLFLRNKPDFSVYFAFLFYMNFKSSFLLASLPPLLSDYQTGSMPDRLFFGDGLYMTIPFCFFLKLGVSKGVSS